MKKRVMALVCAVSAAGAILALFVTPRAAFGQGEVRQPGAVYDFDFKGEKPAPAPRRDISGVWEPAANASAGINAITRFFMTTLPVSAWADLKVGPYCRSEGRPYCRSC